MLQLVISKGCIEGLGLHKLRLRCCKLRPQPGACVLIALLQADEGCEPSLAASLARIYCQMPRILRLPNMKTVACLPQQQTI